MLSSKWCSEIIFEKKRFLIETLGGIESPCFFDSCDKSSSEIFIELKVQQEPFHREI